MVKVDILKDVPWDQISSTKERILTSKSSVAWVNTLGRFLVMLGVPADMTPDAEDLSLIVTVIFCTLFSYWYWFGYRHHRDRRQLKRKLKEATDVVKDLEEKLLSVELEQQKESEAGDGQTKPIRVWMDGAFDMMHYGHMNAFRQGRALGSCLVVGVNSDESITQCKGKPVMNDEERMGIVKGCKWVDEVVPNVPYVMSEEYIAFVIKEYNIDYVVHGDDPCIVDGKDVYESAQKLGKFKTIPRTEGISTTDVVGRMLLMTRSHHSASLSEQDESNTGQLAIRSSAQENERFDRKSNFLTTSRTLRLFGAGVKAPEPHAKVVYIAGSFDMFHAGHVAILKAARSLGDYVIVGVHSDWVVNSHRGLNYPIFSLHERVLSVLGCKYADDVLIDAPYIITDDMISSLKISLVVRGSVQPQDEVHDELDGSCVGLNELNDPYVIPRQNGMLKVIPSLSDLTAEEVVDRVQMQRDIYTKKFEKKHAAEQQYYATKYNRQQGNTPTKK